MFVCRFLVQDVLGLCFSISFQLRERCPSEQGAFACRLVSLFSRVIACLFRVAVAVSIFRYDAASSPSQPLKLYQ